MADPGYSDKIVSSGTILTANGGHFQADYKTAKMVGGGRPKQQTAAAEGENVGGHGPPRADSQRNKASR